MIWCKKKGVKLTEPSSLISLAYQEKSKKSLKVMGMVPFEEWKIIAAYYACYNIIYSLLAKVGIKSEIHSCSIEIMNLLGFEKKRIEFMKELRDKRENAQYYCTKESVPKKENITDFIAYAKNKEFELDIGKIRCEFKEI